MNEAAFNKKVQNLIKEEGGYVIKTIATNRAGVPDILACINGRFLGIEGKTKTGVVSKLQEVHLRDIRAAGGLTCVARDLETVKKLIKQAKS